jgi:transcriptional regulator GlxA family with amidase domain
MSKSIWIGSSETIVASSVDVPVPPRLPLTRPPTETRWAPMRPVNLAGDLSLSVLADQAGMSERSFSRHYAEATGQTPARAIERLRVEAARRLLSESRLPVKRIAQRCGFGSEETMRRGFLRVLAVTPRDYRSRFTF